MGICRGFGVARFVAVMLKTPSPSYAYVADKLRLYEGDAICFVRFMAAQLEADPKLSARDASIAKLLSDVVTRCEMHSALEPHSTIHNLSAIRELARDARGMLNSR